LDGNLELRDANGQPRIELKGGVNQIILRNANGDTIATLWGAGNLTLGGNGADGDLSLTDNSGQARILMNGDTNQIVLKNASGETTASLWGGGNLTLGGKGADGDLSLTDNTGQPRILMHGDTNTMLMKNADGKDVATLGLNGKLMLGGNGQPGEILLFPDSANDPGEDVDKSSIHLNGDVGDIILRNADCAEEFEVTDAVSSAPGDVMVLDDKGLLQPCTIAYDSRTVGVISGAASYKPGLVLDRQQELENRKPIALVGKVFVRVTDQGGPIRIGDRLTTSDLQGHAMKAADPEKAIGAVIGKSLVTHEKGTGLIPIVIALQ